MAYDEKLADRIRKSLRGKGEIREIKMFGGICLTLSGKMFCGVLNDVLVARVDPEEAPALLKKPGVRPMDFTGRPMKGFLFVSQNQLSGAGLNAWLKRCISYVSSLPKVSRRPKKSRAANPRG